MGTNSAPTRTEKYGFDRIDGSNCRLVKGGGETPFPYNYNKWDFPLISLGL